jgi:hypothetical protein
MLVLGLAWRFAAVVPETWEGATYCRRRDSANWPIFVIPDPRLTPRSARRVKLVLVDAGNTTCAERTVLAPAAWAHRFNLAVDDGERANDWRNHFQLATETLLQIHASPGALAASVRAESPPLVPANPKLGRWCRCESLTPEEAMS